MNKGLDRDGTNRISASKLGTYMQCPKKYWFTYFSSVERVPPNINLLFGSEIHKVFEENDKNFIEHQEWGDTRELQKMFVDSFDKKARQSPCITTDDIDKHKVIGMNLIREYMNTIPPEYCPIQTEQKFEIDLSSVPVLLNGFVDVISSEEGGDVIIDRKTSRCKYSEGKILEVRQQLLVYVVWYRKKFQKQEKGVGLDVLIKTKIPQVQRLRFQFEDHEIGELVQAMDYAQQNIRDQKFPPTYQNCSWCDFRGMCRKIIPCKPLDSFQIMMINKNR